MLEGNSTHLKPIDYMYHMPHLYKKGNVMNAYMPTQARPNLFKLMEEANQSHNPIYILGKNNKAVLLSEEDYRSMIETLYIMSIPGMKDSILNASKAPLSDFSESIDWDNL